MKYNNYDIIKATHTCGSNYIVKHKVDDNIITETINIPELYNLNIFSITPRISNVRVSLKTDKNKMIYFNQSYDSLITFCNYNSVVLQERYELQSLKLILDEFDSNPKDVISLCEKLNFNKLKFIIQFKYHENFGVKIDSKYMGELTNLLLRINHLEYDADRVSKMYSNSKEHLKKVKRHKIYKRDSK